MGNVAEFTGEAREAVFDTARIGRAIEANAQSDFQILIDGPFVLDVSADVVETNVIGRGIGEALNVGIAVRGYEGAGGEITNRTECVITLLSFERIGICNAILTEIDTDLDGVSAFDDR